MLAAGLLLIAGALAYLSLVGVDVPYWAGVMPTQAAIGIGLALSFPAASIGAVDATPDEHRGTVAGLLATGQNLGGAVGLAVVSALASIRPGWGSFESGLYAGCGLILAGGVAAHALGRREVRS